jgi:hypothetical protein
MRVVTLYPVKVMNGKIRKLDYMSSIDGKNKDQVKAFQEWVIKNKGVNLDYISATTKQWVRYPLSVDGIMGTKGKTFDAYKKYGAEWEKSVINAPTSTTTTTTTETKPETVVVNDAPKVPTGSDPTPTQVEEQKKKGVFWDKAKGVWVRAKDSGMLDRLANYFGLNTGVAPETNPVVDTNTPPIDDKPKMSKGLKIGLIVGGVVLLGVIVYAVTRPKNGK